MAGQETVRSQPLESHTKNKSSKKSTNIKNHYCDECLYYWCTFRSTVSLCTMRTRGLFECQSCLMILSRGNKQKLDSTIKETADKLVEATVT